MKKLELTISGIFSKVKDSNYYGNHYVVTIPLGKDSTGDFIVDRIGYNWLVENGFLKE